MGIPEGQTTLILASASPRRRQLLEQLGLSFETRAANLDESVLPGEAPEAYVERTAGAKADAVAAGASPSACVLAADTAVIHGGRILGKPKDAAEAGRMLGALSGSEHRVLTAVAVAGRWRGACVVETRVRFRRLTPKAIDWYVGTGEPMDKAGAYGIQGIGGAFVERIDGSASNVVGLPLVETISLLEKAGLAFAFS